MSRNFFNSLRPFLEALRSRGELVEIDAPVDPRLEIPEIHRRVIAAGGPALLFRNVRGKSFPLVCNMFGTKSRVDLAFGDEAKEFVQRIAALPEELLPPTVRKLWGLRDLGIKAARIGFKTTSRAPVLARQIAAADLTKLPATTSWLKDGGPFLTLPLVHTRGVQLHGKGQKAGDGQTGGKPDNLGMYRVQIFEPGEAGMHFQIGKGAGFHLHEAEKSGSSLPVNVYLGGPPALILSAIAPLPENVPELLLASLLQNSKLRRCKIPVQPTLDGIAEAEFCLSGVIPPRVRRPEGPFGDHYGYYSLVHDFPVFRPKAIYHREDAIYPCTVVGKPRQEDFYLGDYLTELLSPLFPVVMPGVRELWSYGESGYHALAAAVIRERYGRESLSSVFRILGEGQLALTKFLIAIDKQIPLRDFSRVLTHVLERVDWRKDLMIFSETSMDTLDYAGPELNKGSKGVILGLGEPIRQLPGEWTGVAPDSRIRDIRVFSPGCLVVEVPGYAEDTDVVRHLATHDVFKSWPLIVAVDNAARATRNEPSFIWTAFTRFNPQTDLHAARTKLGINRVEYEGPLVLDARMKPWYPEELFCDEATSKTVDQRWLEYFPAGSVTMGDSREAHLASWGH